jgi:hypothetical protein
MEKNGNKKKNQYYEGSLPSDFHRPSHQNSHLFHQFLYEKYILLRFIQIQEHEILNDVLVATLKVQLQDTSGEEYQCERDGGKEEMEVSKFIHRIGENRKIIPKETVGPLHLQQELEKQSIQMKQRYVLEEKNKHDQLIRSMSAIHEISQRKKESNRRKSEVMKSLKLEKEMQQKEIKLIRHEEKSQKFCESEKRRKERKEELKKRKRHLYYSKFSFPSTPRIHSYLDSESSDEKGSCYPPVPKKSYLHTLDKKGLKYAVSGEEGRKEA